MSVEYYSNNECRIIIRKKLSEITNDIVLVDSALLSISYYDFKLIRVLNLTGVEQKQYSKKTLEELK